MDLGTPLEERVIIHKLICCKRIKRNNLNGYMFRFAWSDGTEIPDGSKFWMRKPAKYIVGLSIGLIIGEECAPELVTRCFEYYNEHLTPKSIVFSTAWTKRSDTLYRDKAYNNFVLSRMNRDLPRSIMDGLMKRMGL